MTLQEQDHFLPQLQSQLKESYDIEDAIRFVRRVLDHYPETTETRRKVEKSLDDIERRRRDPNLYLCVIGEFSTGKSTFLNALIRDDLLRTDVIQATTAAPTAIRYGKEIVVDVEFLDGTRISSREAGFFASFQKILGKFFPGRQKEKAKEKLRDVLHKVTAEEEIARNVKRVEIQHPSETFLEGLVIYDTPGTNAENARHVEVTRHLVREECDAAIVTIAADIPVSQTLLAFLQEALGNAAERCIYLVTKLDKIRERERERHIRTIQRRLASGLHLNHVMVLGCAPSLVIDEILGENEYSQHLSPEARQGMINQFAEVEAEIWRYLRQERTRILMERLAELMILLFEALNQHLSELKVHYEKRYEAFERNRIPDLVTFASKSKDKMLNDFRGDFEKERDDFLGFLVESREKTVTEVKEAIERISDRKELDTFLRQHFPRWFGTRLDSQMKLFGEVQQAARKDALKNLHAFEVSFLEKYRSLATLGGTLEEKEFMIGEEESEVFVSNIVETYQAFQEASTQHEGISWGLASGGAVIGSFILPGIGTAVGGALGWLAGQLFSPSIEELRETAFSGCHKTIKESYNHLTENISTMLEELEEDLCGQISKRIDAYVEKYDRLVQKMIADLEAEKRAVAKKEKFIEIDRLELQQRTKEIERWRKIWHDLDSTMIRGIDGRDGHPEGGRFSR